MPVAVAARSGTARRWLGVFTDRVRQGVESASGRAETRWRQNLLQGVGERQRRFADLLRDGVRPLPTCSLRSPNAIQAMTTYELQHRPQSHLAVIVEDDAPTRATLTELCQSVGLQVKAFADVWSMEQDLDRQASGCLLLDMRLPGISGVPAVARLRSHYPNLSIIGLSSHVDARTVVRALRAGVVDFFDKPFSGQILLEAVQLAASGDLLPPGAADNRRSEAELRRLLNTLTRRQRAILERFVRGESESRIAQEIDLHPRSIQRHLRKAFSVLDISEQERGLLRRLFEGR